MNLKYHNQTPPSAMAVLQLSNRSSGAPSATSSWADLLLKDSGETFGGGMVAVPGAYQLPTL